MFTLTKEYQELFGENPAIFVVVDQRRGGVRKVCPVGVGGKPIYAEAIEVYADDLEEVR